MRSFYLYTRVQCIIVLPIPTTTEVKCRMKKRRSNRWWIVFTRPMSERTIPGRFETELYISMARGVSFSRWGSHQCLGRALSCKWCLSNPMIYMAIATRFRFEFQNTPPQFLKFVLTWSLNHRHLTSFPKPLHNSPKFDYCFAPSRKILAACCIFRVSRLSTSFFLLMRIAAFCLLISICEFYEFLAKNWVRICEFPWKLNPMTKDPPGRKRENLRQPKTRQLSS